MTINVTPDISTRMSWGVRIATLCLLLISLTFERGQASTCVSSDPCPANRPRDARGCCPRLQGESCGYVAGEEESPGQVCDSVLGYECRGETAEDTQGTCQGPYSLEVSNIQERSATLTWDNFIPDDYGHEYSLLRTTDTYKANISDWMAAEIGQSPRYNLPGLRPGTWYFVRIGVWADIVNGIYANLTETVAFRTKSVGYCEHDGVEYPVGVTFDHLCEDRCTCLPDGEFDCTPLCDVPVLPDQERCKVERYNESSCCALRVVCEPILAGCADDVSEQEFEHGEEFETRCSLCTCNNGTISCDYTEVCERPESNSCPQPQEVSVPGECCPRWRCGNSSCQDDGETYNSGDTWRKESTCQTCNCTLGSVTCLDLCEEPIRPENCSRPKLAKIEGSCCDVIQCLPPEDECFYESQAYTQGSYLTNAKCELCVCADNSTVVCTPKQCGAVTLPKASIFCPHPHIRKDGCCDTLWCNNPDLDLVSVIKNLFGTSYSPHSVTLSFMEDEEEQEEEESEGEDTHATYELQYSSNNNVSDNDTSTWQKRTFEPKRVHSEDEPVTSPSHFLQTTGAIRVGKRVYVTVSGMEANTTYYLKVLVINSGFHDSRQGETTSQPPLYAGAIAVRTLAEEIAETCPTTCRSEEALVIASSSCPRPMLIRSPDACCPEWMCYPEEGGCYYKNMILKNGEQIREHCERTCVCHNGNVTCTPICGQPGSMPRPGCNLERLPNHCCSVWMCPPRTKLIESMSVVISVEYRGFCTDDIEAFTSKFKQALSEFILSQPVCLSGDGNPKHECETTKMTIRCPASKNVYRRRRDIDKIGVDVHFTSNVSSSGSDAVTQNLTLLTAALADVFNATNSNITVEGKVYMRVGPVIVTSPTGNCDPGFIFDNNVCVEGVTPSTPPTTLDVPLRVSATSTSAVLAWQSLRTPKTRYVTGLQIEYQEAEVDDFFTWNQTDPLEPGVTSHKLTSLQAARRYRARLVVFTNILESTRVRLKPVKFETKPFALTTVSISIHLQEVSVSVTSVTLRWAELPVQVLTEVEEMILRYTNEGTASLSDPVLASKVKTQLVTPSATSVTISSLQPATAYVAHLAIFFKNNTVAKTGTIHFVTMTEGRHDESLVVALVVSAVVVVCAVAIVIITCCLWRRSRQREARETAFENKTFGLHIETDGRTLSARP